jgi:flagellar biosynthesis anti-sigma factor FlgM
MDDRRSFVMKIENNSTNRLTQKQAESASAVEKNQRLQESEGRLDSLKGKDKASLSEQARLLAKAHAALEETPDVRAARVDQLHEQVQSGNYEVPIDALAKRLLSRLKDL